MLDKLQEISVTNETFAGPLNVKVPPFGIVSSAIVTLPPLVTLPPEPKTLPRVVLVLTTIQLAGTVTFWQSQSLRQTTQPAKVIAF